MISCQLYFVSFNNLLKGLIDHMNSIQQQFSLYKLPLVAIATVLALQLIILCGLLFNGVMTLSDITPFSSAIDFFAFLCGIAFSAAALLGFVMMVFHHFKINVVTRTNIIFTIGLMTFVCLIILAIMGALLYLLGDIFLAISGTYSWLLQWLPLLVLGLFLTPFMIFFFLTKGFHTLLDLSVDRNPQGQSSRYWRFANMLAIFTSYTFVVMVFNLAWGLMTTLGMFSVFSSTWWGFVLIQIPNFYLVAYIPVAVYLLILGIKRAPSLTHLHFESVFITTLLLFAVSGIFAGIVMGVFLWMAFGSMGTDAEPFIAIMILLFFLVLGFFVTATIVNRCFKRHWQ